VNGPELRIEKRPDGKLNIYGLAVWSAGNYHGYGSPPEGDVFTDADLEAMAKAHEEIGHKMRPRVYPGHPLNPLLKLLARPKGEIKRLYRDGSYLYADLQGVDPAFWEKAMEDGARFSPDVRFNYVDPKTGKVYPKVMVGLGVLGAAAPANSELPPLDEYVINYYAAAYGGGDVRSYVSDKKVETNTPSDVPVDKRDKYDLPSHVYLDPKGKRYPVKRKKGGEWKYSESDLRDAYRLARLHKENEIACQAKRILKKEFGVEIEEKEPLECASSYAAQTHKEEVMENKKETGTGTEVAPEVEERMRSFAEQLEAERQARLAAEEELAKARRMAEEAARILEAQMVEAELKEISSFVDGLVEQMKLAPSAAPHVKLALQAAAGVTNDVKSFALGEIPEDAADKSLLEVLKDAFNALPAKESVKKDAREAEKATSFTANLRAYTTDPEASAQFRQMVEEVRREKGISYAEAFKEVLRKVTGGN